MQYHPGKTVDELAAAGKFPHPKITYATVDALITVAAALGYSLELNRTPGPGFHHDVEVIFIESGKTVTVLPENLAIVLSNTFARKPNPFRVP